MIVDSWHIAWVLVAIVVGWLLGRRTRAVTGDEAGIGHRHYSQGLNYLLNDHPDGAVDAFIDSLEVNSDTLEMHIAIGNQMRRKGEVERAIRVHQNLLARPSLPRVHLHQAHLELARDFIAAGLWDRAERLLQDLLDESPELQAVAKRHLMEIYQDEKEWQEAIDVARQLLPRRSLLKSPVPEDSQLVVALSHYCCELAELDLQKNNYHAARAQLKKALGYDPGCVRASLLAADIEYRTGHFSIAIKHLRRVREQDPVFIPETIALLHRCFVALGDEASFHQYLSSCLETYPSATLLLMLVEHIKTGEGEAAASDYLADALRMRPSLRGLAKMVELNINTSSGRARDSLAILRQLIEQLMDNKPHYQCQHCGFAGKHLHWLCPGCKQWGQIKAIRGTEGD